MSNGSFICCSPSLTLLPESSPHLITGPWCQKCWRPLYYSILFIGNARECRLIYSDKRRSLFAWGENKEVKEVNWKGLPKGIIKLWGGESYVHYLDCGDGFIGTHTHTHTHIYMFISHVKICQIVYFKYVQFITPQWEKKKI